MARRRASVTSGQAAQRGQTPQHRTYTPSVPATSRAHVGNPDGQGTARQGVPHAAPRGSTSRAAALTLAPEPSGGVFDLVLAVVGAEHLTLRQSLALWQREQDRAQNRAWRRPGGLARPAGL